MPAVFQPFIGIVDTDGNFLKGQRPKSPGTVGETEFESNLQRRSGRLPWLADRKLEQALKRQEIGDILVEAGEGMPNQVREIFVTPIRDPDTGKCYSAFAFGLPLSTFEERVLFERSKHTDLGRIMGGVRLEDTLVSSMSRIAVSHGRTRQPVLGIGLAALAVATGLALLVSRGLSGPIQQLVRCTAEIERGNYDVRVDARSGDEIGTLAQSFNRMALASLVRSDTGALSMAWLIPPWRRSSSITALRWEASSARWRGCSVTFVGFTALTEVACRNGGIVDKLVGDLLMVVALSAVSAMTRHGHRRGRVHGVGTAAQLHRIGRMGKSRITALRSCPGRRDFDRSGDAQSAARGYSAQVESRALIALKGLRDSVPCRRVAAISGGAMTAVE